jgi:O-antigen ligase
MNWILALVFATILVLTFSRSAVIGLLSILLIATFLYAKRKIGWIKSTIIILGALLLLALGSLLVYSQPGYKEYFTHYDSSKLRILQYERVWDKKDEIGLTGRGVGTAGPSSQFRLDGGENHWTENVYLDTFEELGYVGLLIYLSLVLAAIVTTGKNFGSKDGLTAFLLLSGLGITGIFINYYTGQAGIFLMWLASGLSLKKWS